MMRLPPGFRFHPTDVELVKYYLKRKLLGKRIAFDAIAEVDIYKYAPWDLPGESSLDGGDRKWYFFCSVKKYGRGVKWNRSTESGYWKSTGKNRTVSCDDYVVGMVKTLVFHLGKTPKGERTDWVMYEYRIEEKELGDCGAAHDGYVLCAVFKKDGLGPRVGAHYGALFREEDWENDENECKKNLSEAAPCAALTAPTSLLDSVGAHNCLNSNLNISDNVAAWSMEPYPSELDADASLPLCTSSGYDVVPLGLPQIAHEDDDILSLLAIFGEESTSYLGNDWIQVEDRINCGNACTNSGSNDVDYFCLEDLENIGPLQDSVYNISGPCSAKDSVDQLHSFNEAQFLELMDLDVPLSYSKEAAHDETFEADSFVDFSNYGTGTKQPYYLPGASANFAASFNESAAVCDQNGGDRKVDLLCSIPSFDNADSATMKLQGGCGNVQKSSSRGDHPHSIIFLKKLKDGVMFCHCDGSSTHVKAEVTRTIIGCTKDALSNKMGESSFTYVLGCNVLEVEFGKGTVNSNTDITFMFVCFCIILAALITRPLRSTPHLITLRKSLLFIWIICTGSCKCIVRVTSATFHCVDEYAFGFTMCFFFTVAFFRFTLVAS